MYLHADNCTGQNKNNAMIQYLAWRVLTKRHTKITLSLGTPSSLQTGASACLSACTVAPPSVASSQVVERSAVCNEVQLVVGDDGEVIVPTYDCQFQETTIAEEVPPPQDDVFYAGLLCCVC